MTFLSWGTTQVLPIAVNLSQVVDGTTSNVNKSYWRMYIYLSAFSFHLNCLPATGMSSKAMKCCIEFGVMLEGAHGLGEQEMYIKDLSS